MLSSKKSYYFQLLLGWRLFSSPQLYRIMQNTSLSQKDLVALLEVLLENPY